MLSSATVVTETYWLSNQLYVTQVLFIGYVIHCVNQQRNQLVNELLEEKNMLNQRVEERTRELEMAASTDYLTQVANRRAFYQRFKMN